jgi:hypothetical protein
VAEPCLTEAQGQQLRLNLEWWIREVEAGRPVDAATFIWVLRDLVSALTPEPRPQ